jgi:protein-L-isoaspartate(D-aspartate) O-methyltransferase
MNRLQAAKRNCTLMYSTLCALTALSVSLASCWAKGEPLSLERQQLVRTIASMGVQNKDVLAAMGTVPRHLFVSSNLVPMAYWNQPLPIGYDQTISQPTVVAYMTESLKLNRTDRVLEIGTGCGYQAAVLSLVAKQVFTIEIIKPLGEAAKKRLKDLGYNNVMVRIGDGYHGWPEKAPFDAIVVTAAPEQVPQPLIDQLVLGGRLVVPVGQADQRLLRITKTKHGVTRETLIPVIFVPMTGEAQRTTKPH